MNLCSRKSCTHQYHTHLLHQKQRFPTNIKTTAASSNHALQKNKYALTCCCCYVGTVFVYAPDLAVCLREYFQLPVRKSTTEPGVIDISYLFLFLLATFLSYTLMYLHSHVNQWVLQFHFMPLFIFVALVILPTIRFMLKSHIIAIGCWHQDAIKSGETCRKARQIVQNRSHLPFVLWACECALNVAGLTGCNCLPFGRNFIYHFRLFSFPGISSINSWLRTSYLKRCAPLSAWLRCR